MELPYLEKEITYDVERKAIEGIYDVATGKLVPQYASSLKKIFSTINSQCCLNIKYTHCKKLGSRNTKAPLFNICASCKHEGK